MYKILIVDDDKIINFTISKLLKKDGYEIKSCFNGKSAIEQCLEFAPQLVMLDFKLPDMNGFQILENIKKIDKHIIVIMLTSFGDIKKAVTAIKMGAYDFFTKPFESKEILSVVRKALSVLNMDKPEFNNISGMMGKSNQLQMVLQNIERVADKDITVFLEGETGTGKELFARMIHHKSLRRDKPFVAVDCGAIPETLFESELFGHIKGAFTGAISNKKGKFEQANGGTLFLDEINNLPLDMQPKFLRTLQENEIQKLGNEKPQKIDVRIIAASNNNINIDVETGNFREDLFYRIHEFKINLPTLQQRREDIPVIANYFLKEINSNYDRNVTGFSTQALKLMENYSWPGNIRELNNVIKSAVLLADSDIIDAEHLILKNIRKGITANINETDFDLDNFTAKAEIDIIKKALQKAKFNKTEAAKLLGISRSQFYSKLEKYKIK